MSTNKQRIAYIKYNFDSCIHTTVIPKLCTPPPLYKASITLKNTTVCVCLRAFKYFTFVLIMELNAIEEVEQVNNIINLMQVQRKVKIFKKRENPFVKYSDEQFRLKYRFSKGGVRFLDQLIGRFLNKDTRGGGLSSVLQIMIALRYWGRNQIQDDAADIHGLTQQSITTVCRRVARAILERKADYINMPITLNEQLRAMEDFEAIARFKNVVGAIDCTHVRVPKVNGPIGQFYINRKGYSSLNVQAVCDARLKIRNIVAHWRGSTHDSRIFNESLLKQSFENGQFYGRLLGDSGYACTPYLFTPLLNPVTRKEESYNFAHIRTRNTIERCFGVWKNRFRCLLTGFRTSLENTKMYIVALAVLHNIAIELNEEPFPDNDIVNIPGQPPEVRPQGNALRGAAVRAAFIEENY